MTQEDFQARADSFNGAVREKYSWSQKYNDVTVKVHLPSYIKKSKQFRVQYDANHLLVEVQDEDPCKPMIKYIDDDFKQEVNHFDEQTTWWFENGILYVSKVLLNNILEYILLKKPFLYHYMIFSFLFIA